MSKSPKNVSNFPQENSVFNPSLITEYTISQFQKFLILIVMIFIFSGSFIVVTFADSNVSNNIEKICKHRYENFKKMGEENFQKRYPGIPEMNSCLFLFKSPAWDFEGKDLIDKKYLSNFETLKDSKILSKYKIGQSKYLVKFQICGENNLKSSYLLVVTEKERFLGTISRPILDSCGSFWVIMKTENPEDARFSWDYSTRPHFQIARKLF